MEITIKEQKENKLIGRTEINFEVDYTGASPKKLELRNDLAKQLNAKPELVTIKRVRNVFGLRKGVGLACLYKDETQLKKYESKYIMRRMNLIAPEEKKEAPKAAAKPPAKKEAPKPVAKA